MIPFESWTILMFGLILVSLFIRDRTVNRRLRNLESVVKHYVLGEKSNIVEGEFVNPNNKAKEKNGKEKETNV